MSESWMDRLNEQMAEALSKQFDKSVFGLTAADMDEQAGPIKWEHNSVAMRVERRLLPGWSPDELGPEERAVYDEERRQADIRRAKRAEIMTVARASLDKLDDPVSRAILELHAPVDHTTMPDIFGPQCAHCYDGGYMQDPADWPCETVTTIANHYGIELP